MADITLKVRSSYFQFPEFQWEDNPQTEREDVANPQTEEGDSENGNESHNSSS